MDCEHAPVRSAGGSIAGAIDSALARPGSMARVYVLECHVLVRLASRALCGAVLEP